MITLEWISEQIASFRAAVSDHDHESAHAIEDELHQIVLRAIADGSCENPAECARLALTTLEVDTARWCA
jgi:hypothetical protein